MPKKTIHPKIKESLGYEPNSKDREVLKDWESRTERTCKPCWEIKYCPYGPLVEEFPLLPVTLDVALPHHEYLKKCLAENILGDGRPLDEDRKAYFQQSVSTFNPEDYPTEIPQILKDAACRVFGHVCPVFFVAEPLTETKKRRTQSRYLTHEVMLKVVRRDGQICQICHQPVPDDQVEFDHIIPFSKGGPTTADNLRLVHEACNGEKSDLLDEILHPNPIEHLAELQTKKPPRKKSATVKR
jgi:5-methylcytosine-specific restriction endonuclease McrA